MSNQNYHAYRNQIIHDFLFCFVLLGLWVREEVEEDGRVWRGTWQEFSVMWEVSTWWHTAGVTTLAPPSFFLCLPPSSFLSLSPSFFLCFPPFYLPTSSTFPVFTLHDAQLFSVSFTHSVCLPPYFIFLSSFLPTLSSIASHVALLTPTSCTPTDPSLSLPDPYLLLPDPVAFFPTHSTTLSKIGDTSILCT